MTIVQGVQTNDSNIRIVDITGSVTIENIYEKYQAVLSEYGAGEPICINIHDLTNVDLTFLQILESARRTARADGIALSLSAPATGVLLDMLNRGGFLEDPESRFFWLNVEVGSDG